MMVLLSDGKEKRFLLFKKITDNLNGSDLLLIMFLIIDLFCFQQQWPS